MRSRIRGASQLGGGDTLGKQSVLRRVRIRSKAGRVNALAGLAIASALVASGCTKDVVLPDQVVNDMCGDGVKGPSEVCDNDGPGCTNCTATPGYACDDDNHCFVPCGDGIEGDG